MIQPAAPSTVIPGKRRTHAGAVLKQQSIVFKFQPTLHATWSFSGGAQCFHHFQATAQSGHATAVRTCTGKRQQSGQRRQNLLYGWWWWWWWWLTKKENGDHFQRPISPAFCSPLSSYTTYLATRRCLTDDSGLRKWKINSTPPPRQSIERRGWHATTFWKRQTTECCRKIHNSECRAFLRPTKRGRRRRVVVPRSLRR